MAVKGRRVVSDSASPQRTNPQRSTYNGREDQVSEGKRRAGRKSITIVHLYPREMNIYGDRGNVLALVRRLEWRGYGADVHEVGIGDKFDLRKADIIFAGGGQDKGQISVGEDLQKRAKELREAADDGAVMLTVCGTYQLFGHGFRPTEGDYIPGIGIFKAETVAGTTRMIGNLLIDSPYGELIGFENHSGQTRLDVDQMSLGRVIKGFGNNPTDRQEGAVYNNCFGTYLHGSLLPKNPRFADELLMTAMERKFGIKELEPLDDALEQQAAKIAKGRPR